MSDDTKALSAAEADVAWEGVSPSGQVDITRKRITADGWERNGWIVRALIPATEARIAELTEALEKALPMSVKPLRWPDEIKQGQRVKSSGGLVNYTIAHYGGSEPDSGVVFRWAAEGEKWSAHPFFAYEHAITAAQADYETRILSALARARSLEKQDG